MNIGGLAQQGGHWHAVKNSDLLVRTGSAGALLAVALGAAYLGGIVAGAVAGVFAFMVLFEWAAITCDRSVRSILFAAAVASATLMTGFGIIASACAMVLLIAVVAAIYSRGIWLPAGVFYASAFGIGLVSIRLAPEYGFEALIFVLGVVWATDSGAFFAGRTIGGLKLAPGISPKKTWAGAIGGLVSAVAVAAALARLMWIPVGWQLIVVAVGLSIFCQLGDLFESWIKRRFGAKDSGNIIPGHGGVMDRVDGLTLAAVAAVVIGAAHEGSSGLGRGLLIW